MIQLSEAKTKEGVKTFTLQAADSGFDEAIGDRCLVRSPNGAAIGPAEELIESLGELAVTVADQKPHVDPFLLGPHAHIPSLLLHPFARGVVGTW